MKKSRKSNRKQQLRWVCIVVVGIYLPAILIVGVQKKSFINKKKQEIEKTGSPVKKMPVSRDSINNKIFNKQ
ncbi:MAG: hypothetical protein LBH58_09865 [Tannerellaceae bacterium]|jgi:hypothetical protein|nr:hypothetical protein [Tannerellaceae bacterium]